MAKRGQGEGSISKRPDGTWWARITVGKDENGKQKRKAFYGNTRKEVQEKLTAALNDINNDTYIEPSKMTIAQWVEIWLKDYKKISVKTRTYLDCQRICRRYIATQLGAYKLKDLRKDTAQSFINSLSSDGVSIHTIIRVYACLAEMLQQALDNEITSKNIANGIKIPKNDKMKKEVKALTSDEQVKFFEASKESGYRDVYVFALATGLRMGEVFALTWDDIDFEKGTLNVSKTVNFYKDPDGTEIKAHVGTPKTKSGFRIVPLLPNIVSMLKDMQATNKAQGFNLRTRHGKEVEYNYNLVFHNLAGDYLRPRIIQADISKIGKSLNIPDLHFHSLRHTFATRGAENGIDLKVMQELLGHANIQMTAGIYTHVLPNRKKESIMKLQQAIEF